MKFTNFEIIKRKDNSFLTNITPNHRFDIITARNYPILYVNLTTLYNFVLSNKQLTAINKNKVLNSLKADFFKDIWHWDSTKTEEPIDSSVEALIKLFTEFNF